MRSQVIAIAAPALPAMALSTQAEAQQSAGYRLVEQVFNADGHPAPGVVLRSDSYLVRLDAVGGSVSDPGLTGAGYRLAGSFVGAYPPAREVADVEFGDEMTMAWSRDLSAGVYNVYRDSLSGLPGSYGACLLAGRRCLRPTLARIRSVPTGRLGAAPGHPPQGDPGPRQAFAALPLR